MSSHGMKTIEQKRMQRNLLIENFGGHLDVKTILMDIWIFKITLSLNVFDAFSWNF